MATSNHQMNSPKKYKSQLVQKNEWNEKQIPHPSSYKKNLKSNKILISPHSSSKTKTETNTKHTKMICNVNTCNRNGQCQEGLFGQPICRCDQYFVGERCENIDINALMIDFKNLNTQLRSTHDSWVNQAVQKSEANLLLGYAYGVFTSTLILLFSLFAYDKFKDRKLKRRKLLSDLENDKEIKSKFLNTTGNSRMHSVVAINNQHEPVGLTQSYHPYGTLRQNPRLTPRVRSNLDLTAGNLINLQSKENSEADVLDNSSTSNNANNANNANNFKTVVKTPISIPHLQISSSVETSKNNSILNLDRKISGPNGKDLTSLGRHSSPLVFRNLTPVGSRRNSNENLLNVTN